MVIVAALIYAANNESRTNLQKLVLGLISVCTGVLLLFWASLVKVDEGKVGLIKFNGEVKPEFLTCGWHLINPIAEYVEVDPQTKYFNFNDDNNKDTISVKCKDGSILKFGLSLYYHLIPGEKSFLNIESGIDYKRKIIISLTQQALCKIIVENNYSAEQLFNWDELQARMRFALRRELKQYGIKAEQLIVSNWNPVYDKVPSIDKDTYFAAQQNTLKIPTAMPREENVIALEKPKIVFQRDDEELVVVDNTKLQQSLSGNDDSEDKEDLAQAPEAACQAMDEHTFVAIKQMIANGDNTYDKLTTAQKLINSNCFTSNQISDFLKLLPTKDAQLEFAKQAYLRTVDKNRFYVAVSSNFNKSSKKKLVKSIMHTMHANGGNKSELNAKAKDLTEEDVVAKAMDDKTFEFFKQIIARSKKISTQIDVATQVAYSHYFTAQQVSEIVQLLPNNDTKLAFAEVAFARTIDRKMYTMVAQTLDNFSRKRLDDYVIALYAGK